MNKPSRFDLDTAIATWRQFHAHRRVFLRDDLDELEQHLRDHTAHLIALGLDEEAAFRQAVQALGDFDGGVEEYGKVYWGKLKRRHLLTSELTWRFAMLKNYFKIAFRNFKRDKGYTFMTIAGLAVGLAVCFLIGLFVRHELSYDRFHEHADRIYRVVYGEQLATSGALAPALVTDFPEVARAVRISRNWPEREVLIEYDGELRYEDGFLLADSTFFEVFSFPLVKGDPSTALARPFTMVITEEIAKKYFGSEDPIGKTLTMKEQEETHDFEITGVARNVPANSHLKFSLLASFATQFALASDPESVESWFYIGDYTYFQLAEGADIQELAVKMPAFFMRHKGEYYRNRELPDLTDIYTFQPITDIHLYSHLENELEPNSEVRYLYIFSAIALLILLIACINYMNLATARSARRAREVGVRKVVGAQRRQLMGQFIGESALQVLVALVLALLLVVLSLPAFNGLLRTSITLDGAGFGWLVLTALGIGAAVGVVAGLYPAAILSRFQPVHALKGRVSTRASDAWFRHGLVVVQFAASVAFIIGTLTIQRQLDYMQQQKLGLNPEQVVVLSTRHELNASGYSAFKEELLKQPGIVNVTASGSVLPLTSEPLMEVYLDEPSPEEETRQARMLFIGQDFLETMEIPLVRGRDLMPSDLDRMKAGEFMPVLVNEAAVREFGWTDPIGQEFACCFEPTPRVVGVVEDFHYRSLKEEIEPLVLADIADSRFVLARVRTDDLSGTLDYIEDQWQAVAPGYPFDFTFMDERFSQIYDAEERLAQTFGLFAALAILIACLGLFGLAAFMAQRRTKEIGIRKVLGASVSGIVALLSKDFLKLVGLAFVIAAPVSYLAAQRWLEGFAYRIEISWPIFLVVGLAALGIALVTVSYQSIRAALADPVESLRYE